MRRDLDPTSNRHSQPSGSPRKRSIDTIMRFPFPVLGNMLQPAFLAVFTAFILIAASPAPRAEALPILASDCKLEGSAIGVEGATVVINGITVTFSNWIKKDGSNNEYVVFLPERGR